MTHRGLIDLRRAATLNHRYPTLRTRVSLDGTVLLEVSTHPDLTPDGTVGSGPCAFRSAVAIAWCHYRHGEPMRILDLPTDPDVEVRPVLGGAILPGGIVRTPLVDRHTYLVTTTLDLGQCAGEAVESLDRIAALRHVVNIGWCRDPDTEITLIHVDVGPELHPDDEAHLVDLLQALTGSLLTAELLTEVDAGIRI